MRVTFWGVRGSYPVASPNTVHYGGHTSCVQVEIPGVDAPFVFDAGTGIRNLGQRLLEAGPFAKGEGVVRLFLSHLHWDHVQGLPFFGPAHVGGNRISVYGRGRDGAPLVDAVLGITKREFFPVGLESFPATLEFHEVQPAVAFTVDGVRVLPIQLNHPFGALGFRFDHAGKSVAYVTDTSPFDLILYPEKFVVGPPPDLSEEDRKILTGMRETLVDALRDVDVVIYDTQYTDAEYEKFPHWGHGTPRHALSVASDAGAKRLVLFHHAPGRSDADQDKVLEETRAIARGVEVLSAREGMRVEA